MGCFLALENVSNFTLFCISDWATSQTKVNWILEMRKWHCMSFSSENWAHWIRADSVSIANVFIQKYSQQNASPCGRTCYHNFILSSSAQCHNPFTSLKHVFEVFGCEFHGIAEGKNYPDRWSCFIITILGNISTMVIATIEPRFKALKRHCFFSTQLTEVWKSLQNDFSLANVNFKKFYILKDV